MQIVGGAGCVCGGGCVCVCKALWTESSAGRLARRAAGHVTHGRDHRTHVAPDVAYIYATYIYISHIYDV